MQIGLYYLDIKNYGDRPANEYLIPKLLPIRGGTPTHVAIGIGSILYETLNTFYKNVPLIICGSGYQYLKPYKIKSKDTVIFVRGEYTCEQVGIDKKHACGDIILQLINVFDQKPNPRFEECTIYKFDHAPDESDHVYIANTTDFTGFTTTIFQYKRVVSDSFHVAAVADLYGIPWRPLRWEQKWSEHFRMLGINEMPKDFALSDRNTLKQVIEEQSRRLSIFSRLALAV